MHCIVTYLFFNNDSDPIKRKLKEDKSNSIVESPYRVKMVSSQILCLVPFASLILEHFGDGFFF